MGKKNAARLKAAIALGRRSMTVTSDERPHITTLSDAASVLMGVMGLWDQIVAHNHPSTDPSPSPEDVALTQQIASAGKLMDIEVLDHLVIAQSRYVSLKERGLGFGG